jgi:pimeloyl-ACP methyl ester carboxylesterase
MPVVSGWEPFTPPAGLRRRELLGWLTYLRVVAPPVPAVDPHESEQVPVLTVPGFLAGDWSMIPLARRLRRAGHATFGSGLVLNCGCTEMLVDLLERRLEEVAGEAGRPVALVGQSRGGTLARMLAVRRPELVAGLVTGVGRIRPTTRNSGQFPCSYKWRYAASVFRLPRLDTTADEYIGSERVSPLGRAPRASSQWNRLTATSSNGVGSARNSFSSRSTSEPCPERASSTASVSPRTIVARLSSGSNRRFTISSGASSVIVRFAPNER